MLKTTSNTANREQLGVALVASLKMLFVALALIVVIVALFCRGLLSLGMVVLSACNLLTYAVIRRVASSHEVRNFASFLAMR